MALFVLSLCHIGISVGVGAFVIGLGQISSFFVFLSRMFNELVRAKMFLVVTFEIFRDTRASNIVYYLIEI